MKKAEILAAQKQCGVANTTGVRTKYSYSSTLNPDDVIFSLEVPILELDRLMMELGRYNVADPNQYHADLARQIHEQSFCLSAKNATAKKSAMTTALEDKNLYLHVCNLFEGEMPHAIYRVQMTPNCVILSSYTQAFAFGEGGGVEIKFHPEVPLALRIDYPLNFRDKSDFAIIRFKAQDDVPPGRKSLIRLEEYRQMEKCSRLVRRVESSFDTMVAGYRIEIQKKEYPRAKE